MHSYTAVTAEMTGVLDALGNLLLTTLFHVPAHLCRMGSPAIIHNACSNQNRKLHFECQEESTQTTDMYIRAYSRDVKYKARGLALAQQRIQSGLLGGFGKFDVINKHLND